MTSVCEDVEELEPSGTAGGNAEWGSCCGKQWGGSSEKSNIEIPMTQQSHCWVQTPENAKERLRHMCAHSHSQQQHSHRPKSGSNPSVRPQMGDKHTVVRHTQGRYAASTGRTFCFVPQHGWALRTLCSVRSAVTEGRIPCDPTHGRSPEKSDPQRQEADGGARAGGEEGSQRLAGTECQFGKVRKFWRRTVGMSHNMSGLNAAELPT